MYQKYSNKGMGFGGTILSIAMLLLVGMIGIIGFYEIGEEFILNNVANATLEAANQSNVSSMYTNKIKSFQTEYETFNFPYDLILSAILLTGIIGLFISAIKAQPMSHSNFLFSITIGTFLMALVVALFGYLIDWFLYDFFYVLFDGVRQDINIVEWFFKYLEFNVLALYVITLLLNQVEIDVSRFKGNGRVQE